MRASKKGKSLVGPHCALLLSIQPERLRQDKRGRFAPAGVGPRVRADFLPMVRSCRCSREHSRHTNEEDYTLNSLSMRQQRFACTRLSHSHMT
jgi:hypothetical protein